MPKCYLCNRTMENPCNHPVRARRQAGDQYCKGFSSQSRAWWLGFLARKIDTYKREIEELQGLLDTEIKTPAEEPETTTPFRSI